MICGGPMLQNAIIGSDARTSGYGGCVFEDFLQVPFDYIQV